MYVQVRDLPPCVQAALRSVGYSRKDIEITAAETVSLAQMGGEGYRAFGCLVDLATGQYQVKRGSWGGPNIANLKNQIDLDTRPQTLPEGCVYIKGEEGRDKPVSASLRVHPNNLAKLLPPKEEVPLGVQKVINALRYIGEYRKAQLAKCKPVWSDQAVTLGLVKKNKAGALSLTTEGKNALSYGPGIPAPWENEDD